MRIETDRDFRIDTNRWIITITREEMMDLPHTFRDIGDDVTMGTFLRQLAQIADQAAFKQWSRRQPKRLTEPKAPTSPPARWKSNIIGSPSEGYKVVCHEARPAEGYKVNNEDYDPITKIRSQSSSAAYFDEEEQLTKEKIAADVMNKAFGTPPLLEPIIKVRSTVLTGVEEEQLTAAKCANAKAELSNIGKGYHEGPKGLGLAPVKKEGAERPVEERRGLENLIDEAARLGGGDLDDVAPIPNAGVPGRDPELGNTTFVSEAEKLAEIEEAEFVDLVNSAPERKQDTGDDRSYFSPARLEVRDEMINQIIDNEALTSRPPLFFADDLGEESFWGKKGLMSKLDTVAQFAKRLGR